MSKSKYLVSEFNLVGKLLNFTIKDGQQVKYLKIAAGKEEFWIKLSKPLRYRISSAFELGSWIELTGMRKSCPETGKVKLKAELIKPIIDIDNYYQKSFKPISTKKLNPLKASVLVCGKSSCWRRGGKEVCQLLEENLRDRGLEDQVKIKTTGCLKQCKAGPNLIMMPDKAHYSQVKPQHIPRLLEKHI
jgi:(2Fe-2S) ferredoxin